MAVALDPNVLVDPRVPMLALGLVIPPVERGPFPSPLAIACTTTPLPVSLENRIIHRMAFKADAALLTFNERRNLRVLGGVLFACESTKVHWIDAAPILASMMDLHVVIQIAESKHVSQNVGTENSGWLSRCTANR